MDLILKKIIKTGFTTVDALIGLTIIVAFALLYAKTNSFMDHNMKENEVRLEQARTDYEKYSKKTIKSQERFSTN